MTSAIDPSKPSGPNALTSDVRANFATASTEISALQTGAFPTLSVNTTLTFGTGNVMRWQAASATATQLNAVAFNSNGDLIYSLNNNGRVDLSTPAGEGAIIRLSALTVQVAPPYRVGHYAFGASDNLGRQNTIALMEAYQTNYNPTSISSYISLWYSDAVNDQPAGTYAYQQPNKEVRISSAGMVLPTIPLYASAVILNNTAGTQRILQINTSGSTRWQFLADNVAEGGANAGSDLSISAWTDAGGFLSRPIYVQRANGIVQMLQGATAGQLNITTNAGPNIRGGAGAATGTQPRGSIWIRSDGAVGTTIYVSQGGGTWNAIAGV